MKLYINLSFASSKFCASTGSVVLHTKSDDASNTYPPFTNVAKFRDPKEYKDNNKLQAFKSNISH